MFPMFVQRNPLVAIVFATVALGFPHVAQVSPSENETAENSPAEEETPRADYAGRFAPAAREYFPQPSKHEKRIIDSLDKPTRVDFVEVPLEDGISFLKNFHKINIWLDRGELNRVGARLDVPITLKVSGATLAAAGAQPSGCWAGGFKPNPRMQWASDSETGQAKA